MLEALRFLHPLVFGGLWAVALYQWMRRGGDAARSLVVTFGSIALFLVAGEILPDRPEGVVAWISRLNLGLLVLFPYLLFRFTTTFGLRNNALDGAAALLTGAAVALALLAPLPETDGGQPPPLVTAFVYVVLVQWTALSATVALRLWRWGRGQPTVARLRMRTMSLGALGLAFALILEALVNQGPLWVRILIQVLALASAPMFLLGFAPPAAVRHLWRRPAKNSFRAALHRLMEATTPGEVADILLPNAAALVAGGDAVLVDGAGGIIGAYGLPVAEAERLVARAGSSHEQHASRADASSILSVPLRSGFLAVEATPFTPFFGRDETAQLRRLAVLAELALERTEAMHRERRVAEQLTEAQQLARIGSWEWHLETDDVEWSDEVFRIVGIDPQTFGASFDAFLKCVHEDDREFVLNTVRQSLSDHEPFAMEYRIVCPDGTARIMQARGKVILDDDENVTRMIGTAQDITERKQQEAFQEQFIANAAHEMRTPLTTLMGFVDLLSRQDRELTGEQRARALEALSRAGDRMSRLVSNLLDLTKLQRGRAEVQMEPVDVSGLVREVLATAPPPDGVVVKDGLDGAVALADRNVLEQILVNLLTNAYRYGGTVISIETETSDEVVTTTISDDGPGVPEAITPHLFDPFVRGDEARGAGGSGLGLAIVKSLTEACGGRVWYEPREPTGASFHVRLKRVS